MISVLQKALQEADEAGLRRRLRDVEGPQGREIVIDGRKVLNFSSNDYLGLAGDPRLVAAARGAMDVEGFGAGASRLAGGNRASHRRLEKELARLKKTEAALVFSSGYMANAGVIPALAGREDIIFSDKLNHASIVDGILLSRAQMKRYPHLDLKALETCLAGAGHYRRRLIVTDSIFSMDGDAAPLQELARLAKKFDAWLYVDEAHAFGVFGDRGTGLVEAQGVEFDGLIQMGTLSKAVGAFGAYVCGPQVLIDHLINSARSFIYTTGMPPSCAAAALEGIRIIENEPLLRTKLWDNTKYLSGELRRQGWDLGCSCSPILPVIVGDSARAVELSKRLLEQGIFVSAIRPPTVPQGAARLRITVTAAHTREDLDRLARTLAAPGAGATAVC